MGNDVFKNAINNSVGRPTIEKKKGFIERLKEYDFKKIAIRIIVLALAAKGAYGIGDAILKNFDTGYYQEQAQELEYNTKYPTSATTKDGKTINKEDEFYYDIESLASDIKARTVYENGTLDIDKATKEFVAFSHAMQAKDPSTAEANINKVISKVCSGCGDYRNFDDLCKALNFEDTNELFEHYEDILRLEETSHTTRGGH